MKLQDCLGADLFVSAPPERDEPESVWTDSLQRGLIPQALYDLYRATNYLSPSGIAGWQTEASRGVSGYFARVVRGLHECVVESGELLDQVLEMMPQLYTPLNRGNVERASVSKFRGAFRLLFINFVGSLDAMAELVALVLPQEIPALRAGRGSFGPLLKWVRKPLPAVQGIISPARFHAENLHTVLASLLSASADRKDWVTLVRLYRNKLTHFGHQAWINFGLQCSDRKIYYFLPREWPFIPERFMELRVAGAVREDSPRAAQDQLESTLIHVDTAFFLQEINTRIRGVLEAALREVLSAITAFRIANPEELFVQIMDNKEKAAFTDFGSAV